MASVTNYSRKLAFRLELELSFRNSTGGLGVAWAQVATRGPVFGLPFSSAGLFWTLFIFRRPVFGLSFFARACFWTPLVFPQTCFWNPFVLCGHVFGIPVSSAGLFLDSFVFRGHVFTCPLSSVGVSLDCLYFVFHHGFVFGSLLWAPWWSVLGLHFGAGGPFWGSVLVPVVRLGVSVWLTDSANTMPKSLKRPSHERAALSWRSSLFRGSLLLGQSRRSALQSAKHVQAACTIAKAN